MRYLALATDYDGTLAHHGEVVPETVEALRRLAATGRKLILVTGRQIDDLIRVFPDVRMFDRVVGENGALVYRPQLHELRTLAQPPPPAFAETLRRRGVDPLFLGHVVVATVQPNETTALQVIRELGLELEIIFNKGSVMILPSSVNKATGLAAALEELGLSPHNVVGIGDAENDHALLRMCECGVAVGNALESLKANADLVTNGRAGDGVREVIESLIYDDLRSVDKMLVRHRVALGQSGDKSIDISAYGPTILVAGPSGTGKSSIVQGFLEQLSEQNYQFCVVDPEGDYDSLKVAVSLGSTDRAPTVDEAITLLDEIDQSVTVNLLGLHVRERPAFFDALLPRIQEHRARTGRPHWLVIDEAHHLMPRSWAPVQITLPETLSSTMLVTVHPEHLATSVLERVDTAIAIGPPEQVLGAFNQRTDLKPQAGEAVLRMKDSGPARLVRTIAGKQEQRRHLRKYAAGDLGPNAFVFRGRDGRLNLRAQNLQIFLQMAEGVDDETWLYHLRNSDYSKWFRSAIKDRELEAAAKQAEQLKDRPAEESRRAIREAIQQRYTAPA